MRSKLFVPGMRPELFSKALDGPSDAISIDMEDSVVEAKKSHVRNIVNEFLLSSRCRESCKPIIVRCNGVWTAHFQDDLQAIVLPRLGMINLPKIESANDVLAAVELIEKTERKNGIVNPIPLLINIETPKGLRNVSEIGESHKRISGLQLGLSDLFELPGIARDDIASVHTVMLLVRMAASETGIKVYDGAFPNINDMQGFQSEAEMARRLGYSGKSCIHPKQVDQANRIFIPCQEEVAWAEKVVESARKSETKGIGVFTVDGKMIDSPSITRAKSILKEYQSHADINDPA